MFETRTLWSSVRWFTSGTLVTLVVALGLPRVGAATPAEETPSYADAIPQGTADLEDVISKIEAIRALARRCQTMECPILDCATAQTLLARVTSTETILEHLVKWLQAASADHMSHFQSLVEQGSITAENMSRAQDALAWQEFFHNLSGAINDLASLSSFFSTTSPAASWRPSSSKISSTT
jgi:hypothetical protein